jgi:hypothetical protein
LCIKLVIKTSLYCDARSEKYQIMVELSGAHLMFGFYSTFSVFSSFLAIAVSPFLFRFRIGYWIYANSKSAALHKNDFSRWRWWYRAGMWNACITQGPADSYTNSPTDQGCVLLVTKSPVSFHGVGKIFCECCVLYVTLLSSWTVSCCTETISSIISILWLVSFIIYLCLVPVNLLDLRTYDSINVRACLLRMSMSAIWIWKVYLTH